MDKPMIDMQLQALFLYVDKLQKIILIAKNNLQLDKNNKMSFKALSIQTYLFHMGRVLIQIREQAYHCQYRIEQMMVNDYLSQETHLQAVLHAMDNCQQTILVMIDIIQARGILNLETNKKFFVMVNTLELNASELSSHMRRFNQLTAQKETLDKLFDIDKLFVENFVSKSTVPGLSSMSFEHQYSLEVFTNEKKCILTKKAELIEDKLHLHLVNEIIELFQDIKMCYVVSRKSVINNSLNGISDDIEELISALKNITECEEEGLRALHSIYSGLESILFSTNTEFRCSRNLFDKAKLARKKFRQACLCCEIGQVFLEQISLKKSFLKHE